jgi:hypothetical protein
MRKRPFIVLCFVVVAVAAMLVPLAASGANDSKTVSWSTIARGKTFAATPSTAQAARQPGEWLRLISVANASGQFVDIGASDFSPGDFIILNERLETRTGRAVGRISIHVQVGIFHAFKTQITATLTGRGSIEVAGVLRERGQYIVGPLAITGGTGQFIDAAGQVYVGPEPAPGRTPLAFNLLHLAHQ